MRDVLGRVCRFLPLMLLFAPFTPVQATPASAQQAADEPAPAGVSVFDEDGNLVADPSALAAPLGDGNADAAEPATTGSPASSGSEGADEIFDAEGNYIEVAPTDANAAAKPADAAAGPDFTGGEDGSFLESESTGPGGEMGAETEGETATTPTAGSEAGNRSAGSFEPDDAGNDGDFAN